jgi:hypothetical protein
VPSDFFVETDRHHKSISEWSSMSFSKRLGCRGDRDSCSFANCRFGGGSQEDFLVVCVFQFFL